MRIVERGRKIIGRARLLERPISVGDAEASDVVDALVLQLAAGAGIEESVAKRDIFGTVQALENAVEQLERQLRRRAARCPATRS